MPKWDSNPRSQCWCHKRHDIQQWFMTILFGCPSPCHTHPTLTLICWMYLYRLQIIKGYYKKKLCGNNWISPTSIMHFQVNTTWYIRTKSKDHTLAHCTCETCADGMVNPAHKRATKINSVTDRLQQFAKFPREDRTSASIMLPSIHCNINSLC
jgi:hypothetical protein